MSHESKINEAIRRMLATGIRLKIADDKLEITVPDGVELGDEQRNWLRKHKEALLAHLSQPVFGEIHRRVQLHLEEHPGIVMVELLAALGGEHADVDIANAYIALEQAGQVAGLWDNSNPQDPQARLVSLHRKDSGGRTQCLSCANQMGKKACSKRPGVATDWWRCQSWGDSGKPLPKEEIIRRAVQPDLNLITLQDAADAA